MRAPALAVLLLTVLSPAAMATPAPPVYKKVSTEVIGSLVSAPGKGGVNDLNRRSNGSLGMRGTDLGASFEHDGRLFFLFGDTWTIGGAGAPGQDDDSIAWTRARHVGRFGVPQLTWASLRNDHFAPLRVPSTSHAGMEVPVEGIHADGRAYAWFVSGWSERRQTYDHRVLGHLTRETLNTGRLALDEVVSSDRFLNVSAVEYGGHVYLFGAGDPYRGAALRLARFRPQAIDRHRQWRYLAGDEWVEGENNARPVVSELIPGRAPNCIGEFSVRRVPGQKLFVMAYGCDDHRGARPRGYRVRIARRPWGPWSKPVMIMSGRADGGYEVTQHFSVGPFPEKPFQSSDDGLAEPDHLQGRDTVGGEYGPYLIPRYFHHKGHRLDIVYAHSTWNPYKVWLMRTRLIRRPFNGAPPAYGRGVPRPQIVNGDFTRGLDGWTRLGDAFRVVPLENRSYVSTFVPPANDSLQGAIYQDFRLDDGSQTLCFRVHGGGALRPQDYQTRNLASVRLYHRGEIVRETFGWENRFPYVDVRWDIRQYAGEPLRLVIADNATGPWGFIDATGFRFGDASCNTVPLDPTSLTIACPPTLTVGSPATVAGRLEPALEGVPIEVGFHAPDGRTHVLITPRAGRDGSYSATLASADQAGEWRVTARFTGDADHAAASAECRFAVERAAPPPTTISLRCPATASQRETVTFSGQVKPPSTERVRLQLRGPEVGQSGTRTVSQQPDGSYSVSVLWPGGGPWTVWAEVIDAADRVLATSNFCQVDETPG